VASVTARKQDGRDGWRIRFYLGGRVKEIYHQHPGKRGERAAQKIGGYVENLAQAIEKNIPPDPAAIEWAIGTDGKLRDNLVAWGLVEPKNPKLYSDEGRFVEAFCQAYIDSRSDLSPSSIDNWNQVRNCLVEYFSPKKILSSITPADADRFKRWLSKERGLAEATVSKIIKRSKQLFKEAVRDRLLKESPFDGIKSGNEANPARMRFIDSTMAKKILAACPDADWRCVFGLSRFCGLRCPSEVLNLKWTDVDWDQGRLRIEENKTELRFCPIFPEIRKILSEAFDIAPEGAVYVVGRYRADQSLRTQFERILKRAGLEKWPRIFHNLRSTCRTELQERFPSHVIDGWLGQSTKTAEKHYLQITDDHWKAAIESGSHTGSHIAHNQEPSVPSKGNKKTRKKPGSDGSGVFLIGGEAPPGGLEQNQKIRGNTNNPDLVPPLVPPSLPITHDLIELIECWQSLGTDDQADLLAYAKVRKNP